MKATLKVVSRFEKTVEKELKTIKEAVSEGRKYTFNHNKVFIIAGNFIKEMFEYGKRRRINGDRCVECGIYNSREIIEFGNNPTCACVICGKLTHI